jgi:hypothetical protein
MQPQILPRWNSPVFVASMGRSGSTLLQRVMNVHPDLTIWGEHGGFLKGLAEAHRLVTQPDAQTNMASGYESRGTVVGPLAEHDTFKPWVLPFESADITAALRTLIVDAFTKGLTPNIRWGFKEVRYSGVEIRQLMELFPESRLVILARDVPGFATSRFFAFGQRNFDLVSEEGVVDANKKLVNMIDGWMKRYAGLLSVRDQLPERTSVVAYSDLVPGNDRAARLFEELGETAPTSEAIERVLSAKAGSSYRHNSAARENRERLVELVANADYDRASYDKLASRLGLS